MFSEKLDLLLIRLGITNRELAALAGFDQSNVSRLRRGARIPLPDSSTVRKLVHALYQAACGKGQTDTLCAFASVSPDASEEKICGALLAWMFDDTAEIPRTETSPRSTVSAPVLREKRQRHITSSHTFGERLDMVMTLTGLSNVSLSRLLNVDASLISRYRSGIRTPVSNPDISAKLSNILYQRVFRAGRKEALAQIMNLPDAEPDPDQFAGWLYDSDMLQADSFSTARTLLNIFESWSYETGIPMLPPDVAAPEEILSDERVYYHGTEGLRKAVIRFLGRALQDGWKKLYMFSDLDLDWLTSDKAYFHSWFSLMSACVRSGIRLHIIHNIDRSLDEMNEAIRIWLPLYMSGMIEPSYCKVSSGPLFGHLLFLSPGTASITAFQVKGAEDSSLYEYHTEADVLESHKKAFRNLLDNTRPMLSLISAEEIPLSNITIIRNTLPAASMSKELAESFGSEEFLRAWTEKNQILTGLLDAGHDISECFPLADDASLFAGNVMTEGFGGCVPRQYSPGRYRMHLRDLLAMMKKYPNYHIYVLPQAPARNMKIALLADHVTITNVLHPSPSFQLKHPAMFRAFRDYTDNLIRRYGMDSEAFEKLTGSRYPDL